MLKPIENLGPDVVAFEAHGIVTAEDYAQHLVPAIDGVLDDGGRPRLLYVLGAAFERFELGALFADAKLGLGHLADFDRIALVTDHDWIARPLQAFGVVIPCPVRTFPCAERAGAEDWISEVSGDSLHLEIQVSGGVARLHVQLAGALDRVAEEQLVRAAEDGVGDAEEVRVLVEAKDFHGWRDLSALWQHLRFVAGLRPRIERVAIVGDATWQRRLVATAKHVLRVDARFFATDARDEARAWIDG